VVVLLNHFVETFPGSVLLLHTVLDQIAQFFAVPLQNGVDIDRFLADGLDELQALSAVVFLGSHACAQFHDQNALTLNVDFLSVLPVVEYFGCHPADAADDCALLHGLLLVQALRQHITEAEVGDDTLRVFTDQDITGLEFAVHDVVVVELLHAVDYAFADLCEESFVLDEIALMGTDFLQPLEVAQLLKRFHDLDFVFVDEDYV